MDGSSFDPSRLTKASAAEFSSSASEDDDDYALPGGAEDNDFGDFNPRKRRRVGGNNKEKEALGIFGSDSEDDGPGHRWKRKTLRNKGMNFVSSTAQSAQGTDANGDDDQDDEDSDDYKPVLGNGHAAPAEDDEDDEDDEDYEDSSPRTSAQGARGLPQKMTRKIVKQRSEEAAVKSTSNDTTTSVSATSAKRALKY